MNKLKLILNIFLLKRNMDIKRTFMGINWAFSGREVDFNAGVMELWTLNGLIVAMGC